jgi:hypothetical protein
LELYDQDKDGQLAQNELSQCPGLAHVLSRYDSNNDSSLSRDELANGIRQWSEGKLGGVPWSFQVKLNGRVLPEAVVTIIPRTFSRRCD